MTSGRPHRPAELTLDGAVQELRKHSGVQFDPDVVDAVVRAAAAGELMLMPKTPTALPAAR